MRALIRKLRVQRKPSRGQTLFVLDREAVKTILTMRETEYLSLVAMGFQNNEIAKILFVSHSTVKKELESIFDKLLAINRANAVTIAFLHHILDNYILTVVYEKYNLKEHRRFKDKDFVKRKSKIKHCL